MRIAQIRWLAAALTAAMILVAGASSAAPANDKGSSLINVNTAAADALVVLPGIGPKKAEAIVLYREANGPFKTVDDLVQVKGIGPKTLEKLRPLITVGKTKGKKARRAGKR